MKNKVTVEEIIELADGALLNITQKQAQKFLIMENNILENFEKIKLINTDGIEPLYYPYDTENNYLRDDNEVYTLNKKDILNSAPEHNNDYIIIKKVIK